jgi:hypothetical protein
LFNGPIRTGPIKSRQVRQSNGLLCPNGHGQTEKKQNFSEHIKIGLSIIGQFSELLLEKKYLNFIGTI